MASTPLLSSAGKRLEGKVALITGGASGIGAATAQLFVSHGAKVIVADIQDELGSSLCKDIGSDDTISFVHCDVTKESDVQNAVETAVSKYGKLDILFSNAGITGSADNNISDSKDTNYKRVYDINVFGGFLAAKYAAKAMIPAKKGSIIFTASVASVIGSEFSHAYASSKHAVVGLANNLCVELGKYGIRVNCISPWLVLTPMLLKYVEENGDQQSNAEATSKIDAMLEPGDIAHAAVYLASDEARYVNGLNLVIDGGNSKTNRDYSMLLKYNDIDD